MAGVEAAQRIYQAFGEQVRSRRKALHLTQLELAERIKLTRGSVANIEAGRQSVLLHQFLDIAGALGVSPPQLLPVTERAVQQREESDMPQEIRDIVQKIRSGGARSGPQR
jgi:transcriptional regulator with XRE-family HTH domain